MDLLRHRRVIRAIMTQSILVPVGDEAAGAPYGAHGEGVRQASSGASTGGARDSASPPSSLPRAHAESGADSAAAGGGAITCTETNAIFRATVTRTGTDGALSSLSPSRSLSRSLVRARRRDDEIRLAIGAIPVGRRAARRSRYSLGTYC